MFAVIVPVVPVPVVMVPGSNQPQVHSMGPGNGAGHGPWNPGNGGDGGEAWHGNWSQNQNDWAAGYDHDNWAAQGQNWQDGGGEDAVTSLIQSAREDQIRAVRELVNLLLAVMADKNAIRDYGENFPCHLEPLPEEAARIITRCVNDITAMTCWSLSPYSVEDRFKRIPNKRLAKELETLLAQITLQCLEKQQQPIRAQLLSCLTKALISLVDSSVYEKSTPANAIEALLGLLRRFRPRYLHHLEQFQRLQVQSLQKIARAIDLLVELKSWASHRANKIRYADKIRMYVDWTARSLMTLKGCSWHCNPSIAYKEFLQSLDISQESISRVMNHAQFYVWNKMEYFWTEAAKEKRRLQWIRLQKAMRMQTALQSSSVSAETEDASAGDWTAEEPAEAMYGEEGHYEWLEASFASEDVEDASAEAATEDWANWAGTSDGANKGTGNSNATEVWWEPPTEWNDQHRIGQTESQTSQAFGWWNPPMEGMTQHRIGEMESQTNEAGGWCNVPPMEGINDAKNMTKAEDGCNKETEGFPRCMTASTEATAQTQEEDQSNGEVCQPVRAAAAAEAHKSWADMVDEQDETMPNWLWKEPDRSRVCIRDT